MLKRTKRPVLKRTKPKVENTSNLIGDKKYCFPCKNKREKAGKKYKFKIVSDKDGLLFCKYCGSLVALGYKRELIKPY